VDGDGASLVGQALGGDSPRLRVNKFQTETEKNEQKGLEQILRGVYQGIRNPRSHEQFEDTQASANAIILFIDYLIGDGKLGDFLEIVSDELKVTQEDNVIKMILQILPNYLWPRIEEVARIRIENKLIRSIESGKYNPSSQKGVLGWLGTWARDFIKYFTLRDFL
jgi:hypothetical protein